MTDNDIATLTMLRDRIRKAEHDLETDLWGLLEDIESDLADIVKRHAAADDMNRSVTVAGRTVTAAELAADDLEIVVTGYDDDDRPMYGVARKAGPPLSPGVAPDDHDPTLYR